MSLTGVPLLVLAVLLTAGVAAGTVVVWRRVGGLRRAVRLACRAGSVLLVELLALFAVGLVLNRVLDIYPSWSALLDEVRAAQVTARPPSALDKWLNGHAKQGLTFTWRPIPEPGWHLAVPPVVALPAAYFRDTGRDFPVVVAVAPAKSGPAQGGWDDRKVADAGGLVPEAVVVFVRPADAAGLHSIATVLPPALRKDLRVVAGNWVLVGVGAQMAAAVDALTAPGGPYTSVGLVCEGQSLPSKALLDRLHHLATGLDALVVASKAVPEAGAVAVRVSVKPEGRLGVVLRWARTRLPPARSSRPIPAGSASRSRCRRRRRTTRRTWT